MPTQYVQQNVTNTTALPEWYANYLQNVMGRATGAADAEYTPYTGARVAGFTPDQETAFAQIRGMQGLIDSPYQNAFSGTQAAGAVNSGAAGAADFNFARGVDSGAAAGADYGSARDIFGRVGSAETASISKPFVNQGSDYLRQAAAGDATAVANPYIAASISPQGLGAAQPWMNMAGSSFPQMAGAYMNPYNDLVTSRIAELGARNLSENLLPQISDTFVRSGQYGSPQQREGVYRALRDTQDSILAQQGQVLQQGYGQAGQLYGQDAARYAGLAGTAGGLGTQQQQLLQSAGSTLGNLSATDLARLAAAGVNIGNLGLGQAGIAGADYQRQLGAGQGLQAMGQSLIQAKMADAERSRLIGNTLVSAADADANRRLMASNQLGNLASNWQTSRLQGIGAQATAGEQQQNLGQQSLNTAYQDFQNQQNYPWQQIGNLSNVIQGLPVNQSSTSASTTSQPGPSTVSQIAGLGAGIAGLAGMTPGRARGGAVRRPKYKRAQSYGDVPRRGLDFMREAA